MNCDFTCDTQDCMHWSEDGCLKKTSITIQEHCCCDFEKRVPVYEYSVIAGLPDLLSEVFVTIAGAVYYPARFLGYGKYGHSYKDIYCVEVFKDDGKRVVDFFNYIFSRKEVS